MGLRKKPQRAVEVSQFLGRTHNLLHSPPNLMYLFARKKLLKDLQGLKESAKRAAQTVNGFRVARFCEAVYLECKLPQQFLGVLGGKFAGFHGGNHMCAINFPILSSHCHGLLAVDVRNVSGAL